MNTFRSIALFTLVASLAASVHARPERNAFLNKPANTTAKLISQVRSDREVADRYVRHFAMPVDDVVGYLKTLSPGRMKEEGVYTIYSVPEGGYLKSRTEIVKVGTPVFADASGTPILIMKCGNPLTRGPRQPEAFNENEPSVEDTEKITLKEVSEETIASSPEYVAYRAPMEPNVSAVPSLPIIDVTPPIEGAPIPIAGGGGPGFGNILGGLALGGLVLGSIGQSGGGAVIPEPGTWAAMGLGLALLVRTRRRNR